MAKQARFFRITIRDGNGSSVSYEAAASESDLTNKIIPLLSPHQKLEAIQHLGHRFVNTEPDDEYDAPMFSVERRSGGYWYCRVGDFSYPYLAQQFSKDVRAVNNFYDERDAERYME